MVETRPELLASQRARRAMIDSQLRTSGVNAPFVIERMRAVPRENFVPASAAGVAYNDRAIPLGEGRWLAAPLVHGMMLQEAAPQPAEVAIVVDGGSGYLAELLRPLVGGLRVMSPEEVLSAVPGDRAGARADDRADLILIDGAVEYVPDSIAGLLTDQGRVVTGVVEDGVTRLARGRKAGGSVALLPTAEIGIPRLPQFDRPKAWSF